MGPILAWCHRARERRRHRQTLYSFPHLPALFRQACKHVSKVGEDPFNPIIASRYQNLVPLTLLSFLKVLGPGQFRHALQLVASSIAFNAIPTGMHAFAPLCIFDTLYRRPCETALRRAQISSPVTSLEHIRSLVQNEMRLLHNYLGGSVEYYRDTLKRGWGPLRKPLSDTVCFGCLAQFPDRRLPCRHSFCEICFEVFGKRCTNQPYTFHILECMICLARFDGIKVHIQPPTAGARILTVDGGGIRGVVALTSLIRLEAAISHIVGVKLPIQEHFFDLAIGTSSGRRGYDSVHPGHTNRPALGSLIALRLFSQSWSVDECLRQFIRLANKTFRRRPYRTCVPILCHVIDYIYSFAADSQYSADGIEEALKEVFGAEQDMCRTDNNRTKVYRARCTSAAPWYFSPKTLTGLGTFQDGGLWQNNPTSIGLWEWPHVCPDAGEPDLVLSLGTGSALYTQLSIDRFPIRSPHPSRSNGPVRRNSFLLRAYRSYMYLLDGEPAWQRLLGGLPLRRRNRFYRLNINIPGREPSIDDTTEIPGLCENGPPIHALNATAWAMIASLFYFELERPPVYGQWVYTCEGQIRCRLGIGSRRLILEGLARQQARFVRCGEALSGGYVFTVRFTVIDLRAEVSIDLHAPHEGSRPIGGSPFTVHGLVQRQRLYCPFGSANHLKRGPQALLLVPPAKRQRGDPHGAGRAEP
ncbi:FabD/lysophospholipase-like protein [Tuber magnatum]|uniref:FabD/lysophospholipase-like protein n=1 Tax=Tuber magnatum TaxID=42249 RepID=A0A317SVQ7_9PEZI|nr:FabD/lysophospholipase-like protein [Tuber magnatum]